MESRLTPGAWTPHEIKTGEYAKPRGEWESVIEIRSDSGTELARVPAPADGWEQARANAQAMAAAPRLVRALQQIERLTREGSRDDHAIRDAVQEIADKAIRDLARAPA